MTLKSHEVHFFGGPAHGLVCHMDVHPPALYAFTKPIVMNTSAGRVTGERRAVYGKVQKPVPNENVYHYYLDSIIDVYPTQE